MTEYRFYPDGVPPVSTFEFHEHRERAAHLEQPVHRGRLLKAAQFVEIAADLWVSRHDETVGVSDLGCGDGGLLQVIQAMPGIDAWGYDFAPANEAGWLERSVKAERRDVFNGDRTGVRVGDIAVMTEVLEHLADPHEVVRWVGRHAEFLVASSPWPETPEQHDECHSYAWDMEGYRALIEQGGFRILRHEKVSWFQVVLAWRP